MYSGEVIKTFKDKHTHKIHRKGSEYRHEDENRLKELAKLGFVKYEVEKQEAKQKSKKKTDDDAK